MSAPACDDCLRRSALVAFLSPRLSALLGGLDSRLRSVLTLPEDDLIAAVGGRDADGAYRFSADFDPEAARRSLTGAATEAVCRHHPAYPGTLRGLADVPPVVYVAGGIDRLGRLTAAPMATIVGTRTPSRHGREVAHELGRGLASTGVTVVSGLALGVDAVAHRGALAGGGRPLGVLAGGVDVPYPRANRELHGEIRAQGVLISELPPGQRPLRWSFPARNRIMAALGGLVVVVEAAESSGTLITAEFATQLGREVGAVPGQVTARLAAGSNRLLRDGAAVIRGPQDALDELLGVGSGGRLAARPEDSGWRPPAERASPAPVVPATAADTRPSAGRPSVSGADPTLDPVLRRVLDLVEGGEGVQAIGRATGLGPSRARAALARLELMGLVAREGFAGYARVLGPRRGGPMLRRPVPSEPRA